jgi:glutathione S-transferase
MTATYVTIAFVAPLLAWFAWQKSKRRTHPVRPGVRPEIDLSHECEFELYHNALSLCSMKARLCLAELEIPYRSHPIDLIETGCYENIRPDFLAVNPGGTVPVLVHAGHPVYESHEQIRYAALHAPPGSPALIPGEPKLETEMQRWVDLSSLTHDPVNHGDESAGNAIPGLTVPFFAGMIGDIPAWKIGEGLLFHFDRIRPILFLVLKVLGVRGLPKLAPAMKILVRSRRQMHVHLDALEAKLDSSDGPWLLGASYSLADVSWLVIFERLAQADYLHVFLGDGKRPGCDNYWLRLKSRPAYRKAILDHSHPIIEAGTRRIREAKAMDPALRAALEGKG